MFLLFLQQDVVFMDLLVWLVGIAAELYHQHPPTLWMVPIAWAFTFLGMDLVVKIYKNPGIYRITDVFWTISQTNLWRES